jgi:hypothetical protein
MTGMLTTQPYFAVIFRTDREDKAPKANSLCSNH